MTDTCPVCGQEAVAQCRCLLGDRVCPNGHHWHTCLVHDAVVIGPADHAKGTFECRCQESKR